MVFMIRPIFSRSVMKNSSTWPSVQQEDIQAQRVFLFRREKWLAENWPKVPWHSFCRYSMILWYMYWKLWFDLQNPKAVNLSLVRPQWKAGNSYVKMIQRPILCNFLYRITTKPEMDFSRNKKKSERGPSSISLEESERFYFNEYLMAAIQQFVVIAFLCFFFLYLFGP